MTLENIFLQSGAARSVPGSGQSELVRGVWVGAVFPMGRGFLTAFSSFFSNALIFKFFFFFNICQQSFLPSNI